MLAEDEDQVIRVIARRPQKMRPPQDLDAHRTRRPQALWSSTEEAVYFFEVDRRATPQSSTAPSCVNGERL